MIKASALSDQALVAMLERQAQKGRKNLDQAFISLTPGEKSAQARLIWRALRDPYFQQLWRRWPNVKTLI